MNEPLEQQMGELADNVRKHKTHLIRINEHNFEEMQSEIRQCYGNLWPLMIERYAIDEDTENGRFQALLQLTKDVPDGFCKKCSKLWVNHSLAVMKQIEQAFDDHIKE